MPCYHPLPAWKRRTVNPSGKFGLTFRLSEGFVHQRYEVPCGRCIGCQLERSYQWAMRCMHEAMEYEDNVFATLTYETPPPGGSLRPRDFVDFMKRLRFHRGAVRFFQAGEYGEELGRPHHHALLFGLSFPDAKVWKKGEFGPLLVSRELDELWGHGQCFVGSVTFKSAAYVARYSMKKVHGPAAEAHYGGRVREYCTMSRRPGLGRAYVDKFARQVYRSDFVVVEGMKRKPPRYYDDVVAKVSPSVMVDVKARRLAAAVKSEDNSGSRLIVREVVKTAQVSALRRSLEDR